MSFDVEIEVIQIRADKNHDFIMNIIHNLKNNKDGYIANFFGKDILIDSLSILPMNIRNGEPLIATIQFKTI